MNKYVQEYMLLINDKVRIEVELEELPQGYISKKVISNNVYYYLQRRVKDKIKSEYIKKEDLAKVESQILLRKEYKKKLPDICKRVAAIERAAKILDEEFARKLEEIKLSAYRGVR